MVQTKLFADIISS